tara:strand:+ start:1703 stop:2863 length:1161 start_codon:yes stop_codon:yes gene_type:complete
MSTETSFEDYVNAYYGGTLGISKRYGIEKSDDMTTANDQYFNVMFGASVFNQLNTKSEVFKLLNKAGWTQSGWRVLTQRHANTVGKAEGAALGTTDHPELKEMSATIKEVTTRWDTTTRAELLADADDGIKGLAAFLRKENGEAHAFFLDKQLLASVNNSDADTVAQDDANNNFESIDKMTTSSAAVAADSDIQNHLEDMYLVDRDAAGFTEWMQPAACIQNPSAAGSVRALDLDDLDTLIRSCLENGANYQDLFFLTGHDTLYNLKKKIAIQANSLGNFDVRAQAAGSINGVAGEAGLNFDTRVGYYDGIPIFVSQHVTKDTASKIYLLDRTAMELRIAAPTTYVANENLAVTNALKKQFAFITAGELIVYRFNTSGKLTDLDLS